MTSKLQVSYHEAGHIISNLVFDLDIKAASLMLLADGSCKGKVQSAAQFKSDNPHKHFIKRLCTGYSGFLSECLYQKVDYRKTDMKTFSPGSGSDFLYAQTEAQIHLKSLEIYTNELAPFLFEITSDMLQVNWQMLQLVANDLHAKHFLSGDDIRKQVTRLQKPLDTTLDQIVACLNGHLR